jgi:hypothetical protein
MVMTVSKDAVMNKRQHGADIERRRHDFGPLPPAAIRR